VAVDLPSPTFNELSQRARKILYATITEFIATGEPVGSRTLAKKYGLDLSAASIRNVLADLEEGGYLQQPHTSAGRIPTDKAIRYFIDTLMQLQSLTNDDVRALEGRFHEFRARGDLLVNSGQILSELTGTTAVVATSRPEGRTLRQLRFITIRGGELLAVLVMSDDSVENRFLSVEAQLSEGDLQRIHELLNDAIEGRTLSQVRELCASRLADERVAYNTVRRQAFEMGLLAVDGVGRAELLIAGQARLLEHPEMASVERLRDLVRALSDHELLLDLLDRTVTARRTSVLVGREVGGLAGGALSVVAAPYLENGHVAGAIGVLGVVRMDYARVVPVVSATARAVSEAIERASDPRKPAILAGPAAGGAAWYKQGMRGAPPELPGNKTAESPIDRALALALAGEREAALRWAAALVQHDPASLSGLLLVGRLAAEFGRQELAKESLEICIRRSIDAGILPIAVAACSDLRRLHQDPDRHFEAIAAAFCKESRRLGEASLPPLLPSSEDFHPLPSVLGGMALLNKTSAIVRDAKKSLDDALKARTEEPRVPPSPLFSSVSQRALRRMIEVFEVETVPKGARIIEQGAPGAEAYIVARGELEVLRESEQAPVVLARLSSGAIFGEMALLSRAPRAASVVARKPSLLLRGPKEALDRVAEAEPEIGRELAAHCRRRMVQNLLRTSSVLGAVASSERSGLVDRFVTRAFEKGERLITQGETAQGLYFLASGEVAVVRHEGAEPFVITTLTAGDTVGEVSLVLRRPSSASVVAVHPTISLFLPRESFKALIREQPLLLAQLYELAVKRDEETSEFVAQDDVMSADAEEVIVV
jgi:cAMP-dependent protein kinase regulator